MTVYHDKADIKPYFTYVLLAIDMPLDSTFHELFTQAWTNVTITLLQRPKNIQIIIDIIIYNYTSYYFSKRDILSPDKPIKPPSHHTISRILFIDHKSNIPSFPITTVRSHLPGNHPYAHDRCTLYERHYRYRGPTKYKKSLLKHMSII